MYRTMGRGSALPMHTGASFFASVVRSPSSCKPYISFEMGPYPLSLSVYGLVHKPLQ